MIQNCKPEKVHSEKIYDEIRQKSMILLSLPISSSIPKQAHSWLHILFQFSKMAKIVYPCTVLVPINKCKSKKKCHKKVLIK